MTIINHTQSDATDDKRFPAKDEIVGHVTIPVYATSIQGRGTGYLHMKFEDCVGRFSNPETGEQVAEVSSSIGAKWHCRIDAATPRTEFTINPRDVLRAFIEFARTLDWMELDEEWDEDDDDAT